MATKGQKASAGRGGGAAGLMRAGSEETPPTEAHSPEETFFMDPLHGASIGEDQRPAQVFFCSSWRHFWASPILRHAQPFWETPPFRHCGLVWRTTSGCRKPVVGHRWRDPQQNSHPCWRPVNATGSWVGDRKVLVPECPMRLERPPSWDGDLRGGLHCRETESVGDRNWTYGGPVTPVAPGQVEGARIDGPSAKEGFSGEPAVFQGRWTLAGGDWCDAPWRMKVAPLDANQTPGYARGWETTAWNGKIRLTTGTPERATDRAAKRGAPTRRRYRPELWVGPVRSPGIWQCRWYERDRLLGDHAWWADLYWQAFALRNRWRGRDVNGEITCMATHDANLATDSQQPTGHSEAGNRTATETATAESAGQHAKSQPCDLAQFASFDALFGHAGQATTPVWQSDAGDELLSFCSRWPGVT